MASRRRRPPTRLGARGSTGWLGALAAVILPSVVPALCCTWVITAASAGDLPDARRAGAAGAGVLLMAIGFVGPVIGRGSWRDLQAEGILCDAWLCGVRGGALVGEALARAGQRLAHMAAPWALFPCVVVGMGAWSLGEASALVACAVLFAAMAATAGVAAAWTDRSWRERPAMGILLLAVMTAPGVAVALRAVEPLRPSDLAGWATRALARATPLAALRPAWATGPAGPYAVEAIAAWALGLLVVVIVLVAGVGRAIRLTRALDQEAA